MANKRATAEASIIGAVIGYHVVHAYGPSFRELAEATGLPVGTVHSLCRSLRDSGELEFDDHIARSIRVPAEGEET